MLETDAPWLPPQPWRGQRNEPAYLRVVAECLAELLGLGLDALAEQTSATFAELFRVELDELSELRVSAGVTPQKRRPSL